MFANLSAQGETVIAGQHDIQNDQVDVGRVQLKSHLIAVSCGHNLITYPGQMLLQKLADSSVVIHYQY